MLEKTLNFFRKLIPVKIFSFFQPLYHWLMVFLAALIYRFPSRKIVVVGVTGTKGKTSILEITSAILEEAGYKTALISTLRFKMGIESRQNELKMTMPGRFFLQKFLRKAVKNNCQYILLEMTSQGTLQFRHKFIGLDAVVFSNLAPEHIEAHGSFEKYREAKMELFKALSRSFKKRKIIIVNADDENVSHFLRFKADEIWLYGLKAVNQEDFSLDNINKLQVSSYKLHENGIEFTINDKIFHSQLLGEFNLYNILAAVALAKSQAMGWEIIKRALEKFSGIPGRVELIEKGQDFKVVVDYAHTPDSLEKVYELFQRSRRICVLGAAGGGRDKWKREDLGRISAAHCDEIILTNEDPYDESPMAIARDIAKGIEGFRKYRIILDRREAIGEALKLAKTGDAVVITGKGTDPWIMGAKGTKLKWDDRKVVHEELKKLL